jgi:hypothetical protein
MMRRILVLLTVALVMAAMVVASAMPAFAQEGHGSCAVFGQAVAVAGRTVVPFGLFVEQFAPVSDDFHTVQQEACEPLPEPQP